MAPRVPRRQQNVICQGTWPPSPLSPFPLQARRRGRSEAAVGAACAPRTVVRLQRNTLWQPVSRDNQKVSTAKTAMMSSWLMPSGLPRAPLPAFEDAALKTSSHSLREMRGGIHVQHAANEQHTHKTEGTATLSVLHGLASMPVQHRHHCMRATLEPVSDTDAPAASIQQACSAT